MNSKAKQRAQGGQPEPETVGLQDVPGDAKLLAPLSAPEGQQVFDVGEENAGERLDRFLGQAAAVRRIALSRTRLKALIEAGEVRIDESIARDPSMKLDRWDAHRLRSARAGGIHHRRRGYPARRGLRGRASHRDRQAGRARRSSGARPCRGHAGQRADPPLRRELVRHRRGQAARHRAPAGQGHIRPSGRRQDRRCASRPGGSLRRPWPHRLARTRVSGPRLGRLRGERGKGGGRLGPRSAQSGENGRR